MEAVIAIVAFAVGLGAGAFLMAVWIFSPAAREGWGDDGEDDRW